MGERGTQPPTPPNIRCMTSFKRRTIVPGYSVVEGSALYTPVLQLLKLQIIFHPSPKNKGPNLLETKLIQKWSRANNVAGMRKLLEEMTVELEGRLQNLSYPERATLLETCNSAGDPDFLERVCSGCSCPHCDIATSG